MPEELIAWSLRTHWDWTEAFYKYGYGDGIFSENVVPVRDVLTKAGLQVELYQWDAHNLVIRSITKDGNELIPHERDGFEFGYENPRSYLPLELIDLLDAHLPAAKPKYPVPQLT